MTIKTVTIYTVIGVCLGLSVAVIAVNFAANGMLATSNNAPHASTTTAPSLPTFPPNTNPPTINPFPTITPTPAPWSFPPTIAPPQPTWTNNHDPWSF